MSIKPDGASSQIMCDGQWSVGLTCVSGSLNRNEAIDRCAHNIAGPFVRYLLITLGCMGGERLHFVRFIIYSHMEIHTKAIRNRNW